ncbi:MAG: hypothetical protein M5U28_40815 [Sandaracinaceae bacterium]|nr:hypothetical protein [Sandaracinaceae bacterium]
MLLIAVLVLAVVRGIATAHTWSRLGAAAGIVAIVVHDLVDFALEMVGVAVVASALLAAVIAPRRSSRARPRREVRAWVAAALAGSATVVAVVTLGWRIDGESVFALQDELTASMRAGDREAFHETLVRAIRLHPAEPAFPLLGGAEATRHDDDAAIAWLNRAMLRAPGWSSPHLETARYLARRGRSTQAFLELRAAEERRPGVATSLAAAIVGRSPETTSELIRVAGRDELGAGVLDRAAATLARSHPAALEIDAELTRRGVVAARVREARRALSHGDAEGALAVLEPVEAASVEVLLGRAEALLALGRHSQAIVEIENALPLADDPTSALRLRARAQTAAGTPRVCARPWRSCARWRQGAPVRWRRPG